jgi:hypothetical protein
MVKREWLQEKVFVDLYGRPYNLSDVTKTKKKRAEVGKKRGYGKKEINKIFKELKNDKKRKTKFTE